MELKNNFAMIAIAMLVCSAVLVCMPSTDAEEGVAENVVFVDEKGYPTLKDAISAAGEGAVLKLAGDVTEDVTIPAEKKITIDLNGHKLTNVSSDTITVLFGAELTIKDSGENGTVDNITHGKAALFNNGTVSILSGTFDRSKEAGTDSKHPNGNSYYIVLNHGMMTIDGGTFALNGHYSSAVVNGYYKYSDSNERNGHVESKNHAEPMLTINGGSFSGGLNTIKNDDGGKLIITDGTFFNDHVETVEENGKEVVKLGCVVQNHNVCSITGGTFTGDDCYVVYNHGCGATHDLGTLTINGGTFTGDVYNYNGGDAPIVSKLTINGGTFDGNIIDVDKTLVFNKTTFVGDAPEIVRNSAEAVIDSTYYATLAAAVADAKKESTVGILNDVKGTDAVLIDKDIIIDGNGHRFAGSFELDAIGSEEGRYKAVLRNLVMEGDGTVASAISGKNLANDVRPVELIVKSCDIKGYGSFGLSLTNVKSLLVEKSVFGSALDINIIGVDNAKIEIVDSEFSADIAIAQRGGAGLTDDVADDIESEASGSIKKLTMSGNRFTDAAVVFGCAPNADGTIRTYAQSFDAEIISSGETEVRFHGAAVDGAEKMLGIRLANGFDLITNTAIDETGEKTAGIIVIKVEEAEITGTVDAGKTVAVNRLMKVPAGGSVDGRVWFDTNMANGVEFVDVTAGEKGLAFARGSVVISGDFEESSDGTITVTGIAKVDGELNLNGASLVVPASSILTVEAEGKILGEGTIRNAGTVKVQGVIETAMANDAGSKVQVGRTGTIDGTKVTGDGEVKYDSIIVKSIQTQYVRVGDKLDIPVTVDPAGAKVAIDYGKSPSWLSISDDGHIVGTAAVNGCFNVTLIVTDGDREPVEESFIINVIATHADPDKESEDKELDMKDILKVLMIIIVALIVIVFVFRAVIG